jgi:hypothetical protein
VTFIGKEGRWSARGKMSGAAGSLGAAGPVIHRLSPWTLLIPVPEAVVGRLLGSVSPAREWIGASGPPPCRVMHRLCSGAPRIASE